MDFLSPKNQCGQTLLRLASRGNAIIAELLRLAEFIPPVFFMSSKQDQMKYQHIILDFKYFNSIEYYDNKIDTSPELQDLDEEFKENNMSILTRFYLALESVYKYVNDLNKFLDDLDEGVFIQQTLDLVLSDEDGRQLMVEVLFLYGVMLLVADTKIPGPVRERLIVSFQRYSTSESDQRNIEHVIKLFRATGYSHAPGAKRPPKYPEEYFSRISVPRHFVQMIISRLRSDDIYGQMRVYPHPEHRSTALATQAAMLYVILYFEPTVLYKDMAKMREIVDKHFPDNWVVSVYMGITVDLSDAWEPYKAASAALNNTLDSENVVRCATEHVEKLPKLNKALAGFLKEGVLNKEYVLDHINRLLHLMRDANVTLRWLILHTHEDARLATPTNKRYKAIRDLVIQDYKPELLFQLLLSVSQYEFMLRDMFKQMLADKEKQWTALRKEASDRMSELADVFGGVTPLTRVEKNERLQAYFNTVSQQILALDYSDSTSAGRKIAQLVQALEEVQEFHQLEGSLQIRQFLAETRKSLKQMMRTINIKEEVLITIQIVSDLSYAWLLIDNYTTYMQKGIKSNPGLVIKLRATFLKLASALELPLVRISQAASPDIESVSQYYSSELVAYVRKVLQIIPKTMFEILAQVIDMQTRTIKEVPTRLDKDKLKDYAQLDERYKIAEMSYRISIFTEGILMMKSTLMGVIKVDPKQLLEEGIRRELVTRVAHAFHTVLNFAVNPKSKQKPPELVDQLKKLAAIMSGFRRSFEYIQDYASIYGLKIWQEEVSRIINYNMEQECNAFLRTKVYDWQSQYQSKEIPIPRFPRTDGSVNFIGRLAREILRLSHPTSSIFISQMGTWYDLRTQQAALPQGVFSLLQDALGSFGLTGLDRLFSFMIVKELQNFQSQHIVSIHRNQANLKFLSEISKVLMPLDATPPSVKPHQDACMKLGKIWPAMADILVKVGHIQLIRRHIAHELHFAAKFDAKILHSALVSLNDGLLADVEAHYRDPSKPFPGGDSSLVAELSPYLEHSGLQDPLTKIYVTTRKLEFISMTAFLLVVSQIPRLQYSKSIGVLTPRKPGDNMDGSALVCGIITLLKQFHSSHTHRFFALCGQYVRSLIWSESQIKTKSQAPAVARHPDAIVMLKFLETYCDFSQQDRRLIQSYVPPYIVDEYQSHA